MDKFLELTTRDARKRAYKHYQDGKVFDIKRLESYLYSSKVQSSKILR